MFYYAELDENSVCISVKAVNGEMAYANHIKLEKYDIDLLQRPYNNGEWGEKIIPPVFEPQPTPEQLRIQELERQLQQTNADLVGFMDFYFSTTPGV